MTELEFCEKCEAIEMNGDSTKYEHNNCNTRSMQMTTTTETKPSIGRIVHYFAFGTPKGEYIPGEARAAVVTAITVHPETQEETLSLAVLSSTGLFFNQHVHKAKTANQPGCWDWPARV